MDWRNLFNFSGRAGREEFAAVNLLIQAVSLVISASGLWLAGRGNGMSLSLAIAVILAGLVMIPLSLGLLWISLSVFFRRLHDFNVSGGWYIGYLVCVTAGALVWPEMRWVFTLLGLALIVLLSLKRAPAEVNRFAAQAEPFFPNFFTARPWVLGLMVAVTAVCALLPLLWLNR